jgi:hypothetical protein
MVVYNSDGLIIAVDSNIYKDGKNIEEITYYPRIERISVSQNKFNNKGKLIEKRTTGSYKSSWPLIKYIYDNNNLIQEDFYDSEGEHHLRHTYVYENKYNIQKFESTAISDIYKYNGPADYWSLFEYDNENKLISTKYFYSDNTKMELLYKYDSLDNEIEIDKYSTKEPNIIMRIRNLYDTTGNIIEKNYYKIDQEINQYLTFKYNDKDLVVEEDSYNNNKELVQKRKFLYDENDNIVNIESYSSYGELIKNISQKYVFDSMSNWVTRIEFEYDNPKFIVNRVIEYY